MKKLLLSVLTLGTLTAFGQSTFSTVHDIFQASCATGCHSGGSPAGQLDLSGTTNEVYNNIVNVTPVNPTAAASGDQLIYPGHPHRSFLLQKCNGELETGEGNPMPITTSLSDAEIALIENWILFGAPENGNVVDYQTIQDYYNGQGMVSAEVQQPTPPANGDGIQLHLGSVYLAPS